MPTLLDDLTGKWEGRAAVVVAGGPSVDDCRPEDFAGCGVVGTNYAHRVWACDYLVTVKDYIYQEVRAELPPEKILAPQSVTDPHPDTILWQPATATGVMIAPLPNALLTGKGGATAGAIHLAYLLGADPIWAVGVDLEMKHNRYHSTGYWSTPWFQPMGWRQDPSDLERVFEDQATVLDEIQEVLRMKGKRLYFVSPRHWRRRHCTTFMV